ncbi:hypothetical protein BH09VER1_BH09VER1_12010 [soil metagenome]
MKDDLTSLLKTWQPEIPDPADFKRRVWQRIEASRATVSPGLLESFLALIARPRVAVAVVALAIFAGGAAGNSIAGANEATAYLRSVNPYAQAR